MLVPCKPPLVTHLRCCTVARSVSGAIYRHRSVLGCAPIFPVRLTVSVPLAVDSADWHLLTETAVASTILQAPHPFSAVCFFTASI